VVCATQNQDPALFIALATWLAERPHEIIIVASPAARPTLLASHLTQLFPQTSARVTVIPAPFTHKRRQLIMGFARASTAVTIICDDDTKWTPGVLGSLVRPFGTRASLGCVFPDLQIDPVAAERGASAWELLGQMRHAGDGVDFHASLRLDGGVFCHHGSTAAYRTAIVADARFRHAFAHETWRGRNLNSGDDQFLCRWLTNEGWGVALCAARDCLVRTRSRDSWRHLLQLLRWSRNDWRASLSTLIWERTIWR
jgi:cellulose synthase/poly-beta-1,6-N-acetylglucosamine synthase-like glycosyltransferase